MSFGELIHHRLERLDMDGTAYEVSIDRSAPFPVLSHSHRHIEIQHQPDGRSLIINPHMVKSIEITEI